MKSLPTDTNSNQIAYDDDEESEHLVVKSQDSGELIKLQRIENEDEENISDMARIKQLASLSGPILSESLFYLLWQFITLIFLNQSTKVTVYAALGLAFLWLEMTTFIVVGGFRDVIVSTCSHEFGRGNLKQVGVIFHKGLIIYWTFAAAMLAISTQIESIYTALGQDPVVSSLVGDNIIFFSIAMFPLGFHVAFMAFLQGQQIVLPQIVSTFVTLVAHPLWCWIFMIHFDWELKGAAFAYILSNILAGGLTYLVVRFLGLCKESLILPNKNSFKNYGEILALGLKNTLTLALQWWIPQIGTFMVGLLGQAQLAAQVCVFQVQLILVIIPDSLQLGGVSLAAYYAAQGKKKQFVHISKLTILMGLTVMSIIVIVLFMVREPLALLLNKDPEVSYLITSLFPYVFVYVFLEGYHYLVSIFLQAVGIYGPAVIFLSVNYYLIGLPCAYILGFKYDHGIYGVWVGFIIGAIGECICFTVYILMLNLDKEVARIQNSTLELEDEHEEVENDTTQAPCV